MIPVVDIFAGPGGLGEGFSSLRTNSDQAAFKVCLSIEKDPDAWETLRLRSFFREFPSQAVPDEYYQNLRGKLPRPDLYAAFPKEFGRANSIAVKAELAGIDWPSEKVSSLIRATLGRRKNFVLIGGPPCQAYSVVGRSRNKGISDYRAERDKRSTLYVEYLQILADHRPPVFVMENVKGLLSARLYRQRIFTRLLEDLMAPSAALRRESRNCSSDTDRLRYNIYSLVDPGVYQPGEKKDFVIKAERFGIPQARHRVIILGVREDLPLTEPKLLTSTDDIPLEKVIDDLPPLRSGLSRNSDSPGLWTGVLKRMRERRWFQNGAARAGGDQIPLLMREILTDLRAPGDDRGAEFVSSRKRIHWNYDWFHDPRLAGACNHIARCHMEKDLHRYFYAACYARVNKISPQLRHFPKDLLPEHTNVFRAMGSDNFSDRFRVQVQDKPATTITSHIRKDGHYYIHHDPGQCRSLTVREAARIQTFPDNYLFCGCRTRQYQQVGNAVPPLLARQIAEIVYDVIQQAGLSK